MPRSNPEGKLILTAGEISSFVVCPQSWHLEHIKKVTAKHEASQKQGQLLHTDWEQQANLAVYYAWSVRLIIYLVMLVILFFIFSKDFR